MVMLFLNPEEFQTVPAFTKGNIFTIDEPSLSLTSGSWNSTEVRLMLSALAIPYLLDTILN